MAPRRRSPISPIICSYYTGETIPVPDVWLYPYLSTQYYSFQHYGAALMGRVLRSPNR